jgi:NCAIR mutase (PurE)-related protein
MTLREILDRVASGELSAEEAERHLSGWGLASVGFHRIDTHRGGRTAVPEVVFGLRKPAEDLLEIGREYDRRGLPLLITRVETDKALQLLSALPSLRHEPVAQIVRSGKSAAPVAGRVAVVTAGSSDAAVAEEAAVTLDFFGVEVSRIFDCGVAGLHRLFASGETLAAAEVVIVAAGMDGALPSVIGGLFRHPLVAVPTSVGYGASFDGLAALLTMLNACAPGVTVVNIDNGFGAAVAAVAMLKMAAARTAIAPGTESEMSGGKLR